MLNEDLMSLIHTQLVFVYTWITVFICLRNIDDILGIFFNCYILYYCPYLKAKCLTNYQMLYTWDKGIP